MRLLSLLEIQWLRSPELMGWFEATQWRGQETLARISPINAAAALQSVSYRWHGNKVELDAARGLGRLYLARAVTATRSAPYVAPPKPAPTCSATPRCIRTSAKLSAPCS